MNRKILVTGCLATIAFLLLPFVQIAAGPPGGLVAVYTGTVTDASGTAKLSGVRVEIHDSWGSVRAAYTDSNGKYSIRVVEPGDAAYLVATKSGYYRHQRAVGPSGGTNNIRMTKLFTLHVNNVPSFEKTGKSITVEVSTTDYTRIYIYVDGTLVKNYFGTGTSYTFTTASYITKHVILVRAFTYHRDHYKEATRYTRLQFDPGITGQQAWFDRAADHARSAAGGSFSTKIWDCAKEIIYAYWNDVYSPGTAIQRILNYAEILHIYYAGDNDSLTAVEVTNRVLSPDGYLRSPNRYFDCSDMAAFISGIGTVLGIPSRMVSLSDERYEYWYNHMFTELYGLEYGNNDGWFLIDPAHTYPGGQVFSSYTEASTIKKDYAPNDDACHRLWVIGKIDENEWGETVEDPDRTTSWVGSDSWPLADYNWKYDSNPWGIYVEQVPP